MRRFEENQLIFLKSKSKSQVLFIYNRVFLNFNKNKKLLALLNGISILDPLKDADLWFLLLIVFKTFCDFFSFLVFICLHSTYSRLRLRDQ